MSTARTQLAHALRAAALPLATALVLLLLLPALAVASVSPVLTEQALLQRGERMIPLETRGRRILCGQAPQGGGAPFRILSGSRILWEGAAGESFRVDASGLGRLYLLSSSDNLAWENLRWEGAPEARAADKAGKKRTIRAADHGLRPGAGEAGPALRALLDLARRSPGGATIELQPGEYHFHATAALPMSLYVSNHDQRPVAPVGVPLVDLENVTLKGKDCEFIFHGDIQPLLVMDSRRVRLQGIALRYAAPYVTEGRIVDNDGDSTTLQMSGSWKLLGGRLHNVADGWDEQVRVANAFKPDGRMAPLGGQGDLVWDARAEDAGAGQVRFARETRSLGLVAGDTLALRSYARPHPAILLYRATDTLLRDIIVRDSMGMALLAQRSENIAILGGGCVRAHGRLSTATADATHFSNCKGRVRVEGALFEGMLDDAINVHATCLRIENIASPTEITCRYMHEQSVGFEVVLPGETVQFIHGPTLECDPRKIRVKSATKLRPDLLRLTLESPLPAGVGPGDAVENADWHPSVVFRDNTVRHNRARGALFTTTQPVLVEKNRFLWSSGSAILLAGDAQGWYESGSCADVRILDNEFDHNLTSRYQFTEAIISICPEVRRLSEQKKRYHRNIRIENNTFRTHRVPLLYAVSASGLRFTGNRVHYDDACAPMNGGRAYLLQAVENAQLQEPEPGAQ